MGRISFFRIRHRLPLPTRPCCRQARRYWSQIPRLRPTWPAGQFYVRPHLQWHPFGCYTMGRRRTGSAGRRPASLPATTQPLRVLLRPQSR